MNPSASAVTPPWRRLLAAGLAASTLLSAVLTPAVAQAQVRLPALGESASDDLSVSQERRIGEQIMREGRRDPAYLDDPVLLEYLQQLWQPLVEAARKQGDINPETDRAFAWEAFLVRDRSVNAFAMPGGYIGVHLGLIALTNAPDQLASVLAHELTHVTQRHIARSIAPQQSASLMAVAALLLGVIAASRSNSIDAANAAIATGQAAAVQTQLNFSRDMEREADRVGYSVLQAAGFSTAGMASMFERLDAATRLNDSGGFPYLRSHPLTVDRISEARNRTLLSGAKPPQPTLLHAVMQARSRVMMDDSAQALQRLNGGSSSPLLADRVGAAYAGALAASLLRDHGRAQVLAADAMAQAVTASPREPAAERVILLLQAQLQLARGDAAAAVATLDTLRSSELGKGRQRPPLLLRAQALLALQRNEPAREGLAATLRDSTETLQTWVADHSQDAAAWELLAATSQVLDLRLRSMRAAAEARAVVGDLTGAIDRLRAAQQTSRGATGQDFIEGSVIDARLRQLVAQRRQLQLDARDPTGRDRNPEEPLPQ
ncbi:MAG: M48 family metalloprotease [Rubrivivax sp.]|nr:M48 family metalloprotease [Rubrivivax sp.]